MSDESTTSESKGVDDNGGWFKLGNQNKKWNLKKDLKDKQMELRNWVRG